MSTYQHKPLPQGRFIRVLYLAPATNHEAPLSCQITQVGLNGQANHEALSYVWGSPTGDRELQVGDEGKVLLITPSCESALRYLRLPDQKRCLWVDSICIDQISIEEKNHQVALMGDIYRLAKRTWIALGDGEVEEQSVKQMLSLGHLQTNLEQSELTRMLQGAEFQKRMYDAFNLIFSSVWFRRVWTLQEFVLSGNRTVFARNASISWEMLADAGELLLGRLKASERSISNFRNDSAVRNWVQRMLADEMISHRLDRPPIMLLTQFLQTSRSLDSLESRDKIYGLYQIFREFEVNVSPPDYNKSVLLLYEETTLALMFQFDSLFILEAVSSIASLESLPSWVPDYSQPAPGAGVTMMRQPRRQREGVRDGLQVAPGRLGVRGQRVGLIERTALAMPEKILTQSKDGPGETDLILQCMFNWSIHPFRQNVKLKNENSAAAPMYALYLRDLVELLLAAMHRSLPLDAHLTPLEAEKFRREISQLLRTFVFNPPKNGDDESQDWTELWECLVRQRQRELLVEIVYATSEHNLFLTEKGMLGLGAGKPQEGDIVVLLFGAQVPMVLRPVEGDDNCDRCYRLVGVAIIEEFEKPWPDFGKIKELERFTLV